MKQPTLTYLGPQGTFTHQAALRAADQLAREYGVVSPRLEAASDVLAIIKAVEAGESWGVIAWENNVEGYVVPNLDALIDAHDVAGFARVGIDVTFDAFVRSGAQQDIDGCEVFAHPHGLAQCKRFIEQHRLRAVPTSSNAAACRDLNDGQVALGPSICGGLYGLETVAGQVQDFTGARTEFLVVAPRDEVRGLCTQSKQAEFETIVVFIPLATGPGVVADLLDVVRDAGLNMTSLISRPIKGHDGTYSFIATVDAAAWEPRFCDMITQVAEHGDWVKTVAVYPRRERPNPPVDSWMLPSGGVRLDASHLDEGWQTGQSVGRELLW